MFKIFKTKSICWLGFSLLISTQGWGLTLAHQAIELNIQFKGEFVSTNAQKYNLNGPEQLGLLIQEHYQHLMGLFKSGRLLKNFQINPSHLEGVASMKMPGRITATNVQRQGRQFKVSYAFNGRALVHEKVAKELLMNGLWLPFPYDLDNYFDKKCTDDTYNSPGDFFYFYDPFKRGCDHLIKPPLARDLHITFSMPNNSTQDAPTRFDLLRANNGNGDLMKIYILQGQAESTRNPDDEGRLSFDEMNAFLQTKGFNKNIIWSQRERPRVLLNKTVDLSEGKKIRVEIDHLFANSDISSRNSH